MAMDFIFDRWFWTNNLGFNDTNQKIAFYTTFEPVSTLPFRVNVRIFSVLYGAGYKIRTRDPLITNGQNLNFIQCQSGPFCVS
jgi:hypothetical protein